MALGFQDGELEDISSSLPPRASSVQLLSKLLSQWSQWPVDEHLDHPTLEMLCDSLRGGLVRLGAAASDLYELKDFLPSRSNGQ